MFARRCRCCSTLSSCGVDFSCLLLWLEQEHRVHINCIPVCDAFAHAFADAVAIAYRNDIVFAVTDDFAHTVPVENAVPIVVALPRAARLLLPPHVSLDADHLPGWILLPRRRRVQYLVLPRGGVHCGGAGRAAAVLLEGEHARG
jgi:hypothetical protein